MSDSTSESNRRRKEEQLDIALNQDIGYKQITTGLDDYYFVHQALPEVNLTEIDTSVQLLGKRLMGPVVISSMVGGIKAAERINHNLAQAAQALGLAMGVGSQRCAIDDPSTAASYQVRSVAPDILLFANLGAVQLNYGYGVDDCRRAVDTIGADALILHLDPLQEAVQYQGNTNFAGLLDKIERVCHELPAPVIIKEVGCGISEDVAHMLASAGVAAIDVGGAGGTSWTEVERYRAPGLSGKIAAAFSSWGIPTAQSIEMVKRGAPRLPVIASGGIRTGVDVAKAIALGSAAAGIATPLLRAANLSAEATISSLQQIIEGLKVSMFCIGAANIDAVKGSPFLKKKPAH